VNRNIKDIYWLAGLLEGEGYFGLHHSFTDGYKYKKVRIAIKMNDKDIITKVHKILNCSCQITEQRDKYGFSRNMQYVTYVNGKKAIGWMLTLYPLMGHRRKAKIIEIINEWKR
jgi:hypothetical protein